MAGGRAETVKTPSGVYGLQLKSDSVCGRAGLSKMENGLLGDHVPLKH